MNKSNALRVIGLVGALVLITFGSMGNLARTVKYGLAKINQKD